MNAKLATGCFIIASLLAPLAAIAADADLKHPAAFVEDSVVTTKIKAKLAKEKMASLAHISVDTDNKGAVVLSGTVKSKQEADKAVAIAHATEGVTSVKSDIQIKKGD